MIFAREISDPLTSLVKKIDAATAEHKDARMGSFVVFCGAKEDLEKHLKELADKEGIQNTILTVMDKANGPPAYKVSGDAEVTVVLYREHKVEVNRAFRKGELSAGDVDQIVKDLARILPDKKDNEKGESR